MAILDLPEHTDVTWLDLELEPEVYVTKGTQQAPSTDETEVLTGVVRVQPPLFVPLTPERVTEDDDLRHFVEEEQGTFTYYLGHLRCWFRPRKDEPIIQASLQVQLSRADDGSEPHPVAWSMYPTEQVVPVKTTNSVKLGGSLKIKDVGVDAEAAHGTEVTQGTPWLRAFNELGPDPVWEFRRTDATAVDGEQRLVLVVRAPALIQTRGTMTLLVQVERKHLKVIPYTAKLPDSPSVTFYVPNTMNEHGS